MLDFSRAATILREHWEAVTDAAERNPHADYISDPALLEAIRSSINHESVAYRFCLPIQLLGKLTNPALDCLRLQKRRGDPMDVTGWDACSLGRRVVARFNQDQEGVLGSSSDPYVGNPMRIPRMVRDDPSKKDLVGWNTLVGVLEQVEAHGNTDSTTAVFRQVLLEILRRQETLRVTYNVPSRAALDATLSVGRRFLEEKSGGDRALALAGALFDAIGMHFGLYAEVRRARINASDEAIGQVADLECVDANGTIVLAVEVKDRKLTLADVQGTLAKSRQRGIKEVFFTSPAVRAEDRAAIEERLGSAFATGHNVYVFDFFDLARSVLALGGEAIRTTFLRKVGEHLDTWCTQPRHRLAWKKLLDSL